MKGTKVLTLGAVGMYALVFSKYIIRQHYKQRYASMVLECANAHIHNIILYIDLYYLFFSPQLLLLQDRMCLYGCLDAALQVSGSVMYKTIMPIKLLW